MEISDQLECLISAKLEKRNGSYFLKVPEQEIEVGGLEANKTYRVGLFQHSTPEDGRKSSEQNSARRLPSEDQRQPTPPVTEGETRTVEIEDIGDQGDGITRVERGYVVIVPDTEQGERVKVEITDVQQNVAFADVIERLSYYE